MNIEQYQNLVEEFLEVNLKYFNDDFDDLESNPLQSTLLKLLAFGNESLDRYSKSLGLKKSYFLIHSDDYPNAGADPRNNSSFLIFINKGLLSRLYDKLYQPKVSFQQILNGTFKYLDNHLPDSLERIMFESSIIFCFYHEFAHLIQGDKDLTYFEDCDDNIYSEYQHVKEYDSDLLGANFVLNHIWNYCEDNKTVLRNEEEISKLFWLGLISIIVTMLLILNKFDKGNDRRDLYIKERKHPHEAVRIHYILLHYVNNVKTTFKLNVDIVEGLAYCLHFSKEYFLGTDHFTFYSELLTKNNEILNHYCDELEILSDKSPKMSRHFIDKLI